MLSYSAVLLPYPRDYLPHVAILLMAAFTAGLAASFVVTCTERVKVMMQANGKVYSSGMKCIRSVVAREGWWGFFTLVGLESQWLVRYLPTESTLIPTGISHKLNSLITWVRPLLSSLVPLRAALLGVLFTQLTVSNQ